VLLPGAGLLALSVVALPLVASASDTPDPGAPIFGGNFEMDLGAAPVRVAFDRPFLFHPIVGLQMFPSSALLTSLDARQGSASLVGLGPAETAGGLLGQVIPSSAADVASLVSGLPGLLGLPLPAVPLPPLPSDPFPPIPAPVPPPAPNTVNTNYPFTPDAQTGFGTFDGGGVMRSSSGTAESHTAANSVNSQASAVSFSSALLGPTGVLSVGGMRSSTDGVVRTDDVRGTATSVLSDIDILGVISIDSLTSTTTLVGDGAKSSSISTVTLGGVTALGYPAVIDARGITITGNGVLPDSTIASLNSQLHQALDKAGITVTLAKGGSSKAKADSTSHAVSESAGLKIDVAQTPPADVPVAGGTTTTVEIGLGYSRGSIMTGPDYSRAGASAADAGAAGDSTAGGSAAAGGLSGLAGTVPGGVDAAGLLPSIGLAGAGTPASGSTSPGVFPGDAGASSATPSLTSLNDELARTAAFSHTRLGWVSIWPLLVVIAIAVALAGNLWWSGAAAGSRSR
jgi:hypothetical protein